MMKRLDRRNTIYFGFEDARACAEQGDVDAAHWIYGQAAGALRGGVLPADMGSWLADRLAEIADGGAPDVVLMLRRSRGRPRRTDIADRHHAIFRAVEAMSEQAGLERAYDAAAKQFEMSRAHVKGIHLRWRTAQRDAWNEELAVD
jgi:hypothetical protein